MLVRNTWANNHGFQFIPRPVLPFGQGDSGNILIVLQIVMGKYMYLCSPQGGNSRNAGLTKAQNPYHLTFHTMRNQHAVSLLA